MLAWTSANFYGIIPGFFQLSRHTRSWSGHAAQGRERQLPPGYDIDTHFTPRYNPWDQRLCAVPDGDLFKAITTGRRRSSPTRSSASPRGPPAESGEELEADIIVTATGLDLLFLGGVELTVDGAPVDLSTRLLQGHDVRGVPNLALVIGYTNASWTLKADLTCDYVCRLLNYMKAQGLHPGGCPGVRESDGPRRQ